MIGCHDFRFSMVLNKIRGFALLHSNCRHSNAMSKMITAFINRKYGKLTADDGKTIWNIRDQWPNLFRTMWKSLKFSKENYSKIK